MSLALLIGALALTPTASATCDAKPFTLHKPSSPAAAKPIPKPKPVAAARPKAKVKIGCKSG